VARSTHAAQSKQAWLLAAKQHGVVSRRDLVALGYSIPAIEHRIAIGRLHPIERGVYAVGRPTVTLRGRWMAAVLACGDKAALSHRSAAALWGIGKEPGDLVEVSVRRRTALRRRRIRTRSRPTLPAVDVTRHDGIPLTTPSRTLLDLATLLAPSALERAVNDADKRNLADPEALREFVSARAGQPGAAPLRSLLDRHSFRLSDSELEILFRAIAADAGLSPPRTKAIVGGFEVDFFWPELGLIVETDGLTYHRTPSAQARDRLRDQTHTAAGLTTLRFTHYQVKYEPAHVLKILVETVQRLADIHAA
jgi:very-short-patch-repair endonuclease